jgi:hypothetical protein
MHPFSRRLFKEDLVDIKTGIFCVALTVFIIIIDIKLFLVI